MSKIKSFICFFMLFAILSCGTEKDNIKVDYNLTFAFSDDGYQDIFIHKLDAENIDYKIDVEGKVRYKFEEEFIVNRLIQEIVLENSSEYNISFPDEKYIKILENKANQVGVFTIQKNLSGRIYLYWTAKDDLTMRPILNDVMEQVKTEKIAEFEKSK